MDNDILVVVLALVFAGVASSGAWYAGYKTGIKSYMLALTRDPFTQITSLELMKKSNIIKVTYHDE